MTDPSGEPDHPDQTDPADPVEDPGWPKSFLLLVGAGTLYLVLRFADLLREWL